MCSATASAAESRAPSCGSSSTTFARPGMSRLPHAKDVIGSCKKKRLSSQEQSALYFVYISQKIWKGCIINRRASLHEKDNFNFREDQIMTVVGCVPRFRICCGEAIRVGGFDVFLFGLRQMLLALLLCEPVPSRPRDGLRPPLVHHVEFPFRIIMGLQE